MASLVAARVLAEHVGRVTIVERDDLVAADTAVTNRRGVPQGRHLHAVLASGLRLLDGWFPGLADELIDGGAEWITGANGSWFQGGAHRVRVDTGLRVVAVGRPFLEANVRRRVAELPNVEIRSNVAVDELVVHGDRVAGAVVDGHELEADLVVDCSGRHTRFTDQLAQSGFPTPDTSVVKVDIAYGTKVMRRGPDDLDGKIYAASIGSEDNGFRGGLAFPMEGNRWILTVAGFHGDVPPTDDADFLEFARTLPSPELADLLERTEHLTPVMTHRFPSSQRRHFERLRRCPAGYVALGDAICSFNPIYGQGMSSAALQADALGGVIARRGLASPSLPRDFYRRAAKVVDNPWTIAAGADFVHPRTTGTKPAGTDFINRYVARVMLACHTDPRVEARMLAVQNLIASPTALMTPPMMLRVLRSARRSPAARGATEGARDRPTFTPA